MSLCKKGLLWVRKVSSGDIVTPTSWIAQDNPKFKLSVPSTPESHERIQDSPMAMLRGHPMTLVAACQATRGQGEPDCRCEDVDLVMAETGLPGCSRP